MKISKGRDDEVFVVGEHKLLVRVAELIDVVNAAEHVRPSSHAIDDLRSLRRSDRVDEATVTAMSEQRRDEPIIVARLFGEGWIVDGNHRLERRRRDGLAEAQAIEAPPPILVTVVEPLGF